VNRGQATDVERLELAIPPEPGSIAMARIFGAAVARHFGCDEDAVEDVKIALSEACTNSVKAHRDSGIDLPIRVVGTAEEDELVFEVVDEGPGIDLRKKEIPADATPPGGLFEGSLGLTVIQSLFPTAEIGPNADVGTTVRFRVKRGTVIDLD
jgi:serine/threonine-protein kinase RsbW